MVSITSGPDRPSRPSSLMITASHRRETMPMPPKQPYWPPSSTSTGTPAPRSRSTARMISEMAIRPALASCRRTPPDSTSSRTASGRSSRARSSRPTILAPWTSPTAPPMKRALLRRQQARAGRAIAPRPTITPSSKAAGVSSWRRCGLTTRSCGGRNSSKLPASSKASIRPRAVFSYQLWVMTPPPV